MSEKTPTTKEMVAEIVDFVRRSDPHADLSQKRMADMIGRDRSRLSVAFMQEMGVSYTDFVQRHRIALAMRHMISAAQARQSFEAEALTHAVGLKDIEAFRLLFERETGGTPFDFFQRSRNVLQAVIENSIQKFEAGKLHKSVKNIEGFVEAQMQLWLEREIAQIGNPDPSRKGVKKDYTDQALSKEFRDLPNQRKEESLARMEEVQEYLRHANLERENLGLEAVAQKFGYGRTGFQKAFTRAAGKSYSAFIEEIRVEAAKKLLPQMPPKNVAIKVGMGERAFRDMFKKNTGQTPSEYQNNAAQHTVFNDLEC